MNKESERNTSYWKANLKIISWLMIVWFLCSFGFGIIFSDTLDQFRIGGFKLGFWFAQQGSIYIFILLVFVYVYLMNKLDKNYAETEEKD
jgi:putative solute:sodium symporter small subunit|tara:strand:+ start:951 stop:1220 length:270 start_codon:yes stop_codon:yes gene_type:complete